MKFKTDARLSVAAVVVCAGRGQRSGLPYNKVLHCIGCKTVLESVLDVLCRTEVEHITVVSSPEDLVRITELTAEYSNTTVVIGGETRAQSVVNGLKAHECDIVVIHDGARPFVTEDIIARSIDSAVRYGSGIAAVKSIDTVKRVTADGVTALPRDELYNVQTPQTFRYSEILSAYDSMTGAPTDDAEVYERAGFSPRLIEGDYSNKKLTTPADLLGLSKGCKIGVGFDLHRLVTDRKLILGGVEIPYELGLLGHSDADVLTHAIMDALLSAANLSDIGALFPDTDERYKGISSMTLLSDVLARITDGGYAIGNISAVVMAQKPKLAPHIDGIRNSLCAALAIDKSRINVSATTTEGIGLIGEGNAIAVSAACILTENSIGYLKT